MKQNPVKNHPTVACCGLDCGLCPTYNSTSTSKCPGCCGPNFSEKHPSCSIITCCINNNNFETCADCNEFPCSKMTNWDLGDSFISHKKSLINLKYIKERGIEAFVIQQKKRMDILGIFLDQFNDGRAKSFFCIATALLSIESLEESLAKAKQQIKDESVGPNNIKAKLKIIKGYLDHYAKKEGVELKLRKR